MGDTGWWIPNYEIAESIYGWKGKGCFSFYEYGRHYNIGGLTCSLENTEIVSITKNGVRN
jgi:hypothetical protein